MPVRMPSPVSDSLPRRSLRACLARRRRAARRVVLGAAAEHAQAGGRPATRRPPSRRRFGPQSAGSAQAIQPPPATPRAEAKVYHGHRQSS